MINFMASTRFKPFSGAFRRIFVKIVIAEQIF